MKKFLSWLILGTAAWAAPLTLDEVILRASQHHPKMRGARLLHDMAQAKITEKEGAFDPSFFSSTEFLRYNSSGTPRMSDEHDLGVQIQDVSGWKLISGYRRHQGSVKSPSSLTGEGGEFFIEFKMPLLRGLDVNPKQTQLEQAKLGLQLADAQALLTRLEVLLVASLSYWDWCGACTELALLERNVRLAEERLAQVAVRVKSGELPRIDEVEASQEVQRRLEAVEKSRRNVQKNLFKLSLYLWNSDGQVANLPEPDSACFTFPEELSKELPGLPAGPYASPANWSAEEVAKAELDSIRQRPELREIEFEQRYVALDKALAENDLLPILDMTLGPGWDSGFKSVGMTYKVGLQLTIPLANRSADGRIAAAQLKSTKLDLDQVMEIQRILAEVRDAGSLVSASQNRLRPALESVRLALQLEKAERLKFSVGDSTLFLVNQRERATMTEAVKLIEIWTDGLKGKALLEAASGRL